jgi:methionine synthase II (cobalamin-independent)
MPPRFRADHIGSYLRPKYLLDAHVVHPTTMTILADGKKVDHSTYKATEHAAISWIVSQQLKRHIRPITSGEYERELFSGGFFERIHGFEAKTVSLGPDGPCRTGYGVDTFLRSIGCTEKSIYIATEKISYEQSPFLEDWLVLRGLVPEELWGECKITLPSPTWLAYQLKKNRAYEIDVYEDDGSFFDDVALCYRKEIRTLYDAGVRNIQIDDPHFTFLCDETQVQGIRRDGEDPEALLSVQIAVHNKCLNGRPKDLHVGIHLCRGNFTGGTYFAQGGYEKIAARIFSELFYDTFYLEYDSERSGDFRPLRYLPRAKNVVLGVVSTKECQMEDLVVLKRRVEEAADIIAKGQGRTREEVMDNIAVSPQCGFSSAASGGGVRVTMEVMWEKLELVKKLAMELFPEKQEEGPILEHREVAVPERKEDVAVGRNEDAIAERIGTPLISAL